MAEPTTSTATFALAGAGILATLIHGDAGIIIGAFAGASVFVFSNVALTNFKKLVFLILSFAAGVLAANTVATILDVVAPDPVEVPDSVGALVAAAIVVRVLLIVIEKPQLLLGGKKK